MRQCCRGETNEYIFCADMFAFIVQFKQWSVNAAHPFFGLRVCRPRLYLKPLLIHTRKVKKKEVGNLSIKRIYHI